MKAAMEAGRLATSFNVNRWRSVEVAEIARAAGYEWLFLDLEHGTQSEDLAGQIALTAMALGVTPVARVGTDQFYQAALATKYPPLGARSLTSPLAQAEYASAGDPESMAALNRETLTIVMIETRQALDNAEAIARADGVDALLIGTNDLAADLGIAGRLGDDRIAAAYETVGRACRAAGKFFGMGGVYAKDLMQRYLKTGVQFMLGGGDIGFLLEAAKARRELIRAIA
jgi:2-keto-3-deoxy-L-rhamnonate aldolase RhmA